MNIKQSVRASVNTKLTCTRYKCFIYAQQSIEKELEKIEYIYSNARHFYRSWKKF